MVSSVRVVKSYVNRRIVEKTHDSKHESTKRIIHAIETSIGVFEGGLCSLDDLMDGL